MSITSDLKSYTDKAVNQGKSQFNEATVQADKFYSQAKSNVSDIAEAAGGAASDLRQSAEKAIRYDDIKAAVEPYVEQARGYYNALVVERAEQLLAEAKKDKRLAPIIERAEQVYGQVEEKVVQPVLTRTGLTAKSTTRRKPAARKSTAKAKATATSRPAAKKASPRKAAAKKSARA